MISRNDWNILSIPLKTKIKTLQIFKIIYQLIQFSALLFLLFNYFELFWYITIVLLLYIVINLGFILLLAAQTILLYVACKLV